MSSAKTVAQKPGGSVSPETGPGQFAFAPGAAAPAARAKARVAQTLGSNQPAHREFDRLIHTLLAAIHPVAARERFTAFRPQPGNRRKSVRAPYRSAFHRW